MSDLVHVSRREARKALRCVPATGCMILSKPTAGALTGPPTPLPLVCAVRSAASTPLDAAAAQLLARAHSASASGARALGPAGGADLQLPSKGWRQQQQQEGEKEPDESPHHVVVGDSAHQFNYS